MGHSFGKPWFTSTLALAVAASLLVAVAPSPSQAGAEPVPDGDAPAAELSDEAQAAFASAAESGEPVQIESLTDEVSLTFANPDGTLTSELSAGPERVFDPAAGWQDIDVELHDADGEVRPRIAAADVAFSDGGAPTLVSLSDAEGRGMTLRWAGVDLPEPELSGSVATYRDVELGIDLELEAQPSGFAKRIIVRERPAVAPVWRFELVPEELDTAVAADGMPELVDDGDETVVAFDGLWMWGAGTHAHADEPTHVAEVDSRLISRRTSTVLEVTPDYEFLTDPAVELPITIDPTASIPYTDVVRDTFVQSNIANTSQSGSAELRVGTYDGGSTKARSLLLFDLGVLNGVNVQDAKLQLYNDHSWSCSKRAVNVLRNSEPFSNSTVWSTRPAAGSAQTSPTFAHGYSTSCPNAWQDLDVTPIVRSWASGAASNLGFQLRAVDENDSAGWKKFRSSDASSGRPKMTVTYNSYPLTPSSRSVTPVVNGFRTSLTPTLNATFRDPDPGATGVVGHRLFDSAGTQIWSGSGPNVAAGENSPRTVSSGTLKHGQTYTWRARGYDGIDYGPYASDATFTMDVLGPTSPTISSTTHPTATTWYSNRDVSASWTASTDSPAGVAGYAVRLTKDPETVPTNSYLQTARTFTTAAGSDGIWYLHVRPKDVAGNWGAVTRRQVRIDTAEPPEPETPPLVHVPLSELELDMEAGEVLEKTFMSIQLWPSSEHLEQLPEGQPFSLFVAESQPIHLDANLQLDLDPADIPPEYISADGQIDATLLVGHGDNPEPLQFSAQLDDAGEAWASDGTDIVEGVLDADVLADVAGRYVEEAGNDEPSLEMRAAAPSCVYSKGNRFERSVRTGRVNAGVGAVGGRFEFVDEKSSKVTVGVAVQGSNGWYASGTSSASTQIGWKSAAHGNAAFDTLWFFRRYTSKRCKDKVRVESYSARGSTLSIEMPNWNTHCGRVHDGPWWRASGTAGGFSAGASVMGASVSSQSGYSSGVKVTYEFTSAKKGKICGNTADKEAAPRIMSRVP